MKTKVIAFRVPAKLYTRIVRAAKGDKRKKSDFLALLVERALDGIGYRETEAGK